MSDLSADELERLAAAATKRPWMVDSTAALGAYGIWRDSTTLMEDEEMVQVCSMLPREKLHKQKERDADAAFIVYLANHATDLATVVRENERLREKLAAKGEEVERQLLEWAQYQGRPIGPILMAAEARRIVEGK